MRTCVVATAMLVAAMLSPSAHAQSRVSVEVGGVVSAYDVQSGVASARSGVRVPDPGVNGTSATVSGGSTSTFSDAIGAFEVRPTVTLDNGFLMAVGFRVGKAGLGDVGSSLLGADIALGFQHRFGHFMPFLRGIFGLNSYEIPNSNMVTQVDLRLDAEIGTRLYVSQRMYLAAAAFAGFGDRYGAAVSIGGDIVQVFRRGVMP